MKRKKNSKYDAEKIFSTIVTLAIIAALIVGVVSIVKSTQSDNDNSKNNYIDLNVANGETTDEDVAKVDPTTEAPTKETDPVPEETTPIVQVIDPVPEEADPVNSDNIVSNYSFGEESTLAWPVSGEVIMKYNITNTVYFKTMNEYKTNPALIIGADVDSSVCAAAPGVVESVTTSEKTGVTVVVAIGSGYELTYGQLKDVTVAAGDTVEAGAEIGKIAEPSRFYIKEGSNLYFKLMLEDKTLDPMLFLD